MPGHERCKISEAAEKERETVAARPNVPTGYWRGDAGRPRYHQADGRQRLGQGDPEIAFDRKTPPPVLQL
jgi:hypothetical protein